jgi:hypothetical protein
MTDRTLDAQIAETQAEIAASERQKSAPRRLADLLLMKRRHEQEHETAEQTRARIEAERLVDVHATGAAVDDALEALVLAVNKSDAAQKAFFEVTKRTETRHAAGALAVRIFEAALRGTPHGVRPARFTDFLPAEPGKLPRYMAEAYARSDALSSPADAERRAARQPQPMPAAPEHARSRGLRSSTPMLPPAE